MDFFFTTPFKIFMTGLSIALLVTFGIAGVQIEAARNAAQVAAYDVANSTANPNTVATAGAQSVLQGSNITASGAQNNGIGYATVNYTPPAGLSRLFSFLGAPNPNQPITVSAQALANPTLATLSASPNTTGVGGAIALTGQLKIVGSVAGAPSVSFSDNGAGGSFSGQGVSPGSGVYNFSATYTVPASIPGNQTSELIKITASLTGTNSTAITTQTFVLVTQAPSSSGVSSVTAGTGISIGGTSSNPVINNTGVLGVGAGAGISVSGGQNPTISNIGVTSVNGMTGNVNLPSGGFTNVVTYYTPGSYTFAVPSGIDVIYGVVIGGGGGGGASLQSIYPANSGGFGGGVSEGLLQVTPGQNITVTVGAGGLGGTGNAGSGQYGGSSSLGSMIANGGPGNVYTGSSERGGGASGGLLNLTGNPPWGGSLWIGSSGGNNGANSGVSGAGGSYSPGNLNGTSGAGGGGGGSLPQNGGDGGNGEVQIWY